MRHKKLYPSGHSDHGKTPRDEHRVVGGVPVLRVGGCSCSRPMLHISVGEVTKYVIPLIVDVNGRCCPGEAWKAHHHQGKRGMRIGFPIVLYSLYVCTQLE